MSSLTIRWQNAELPEHGGEMGHGFCVYARSKHHRARLVAFVDGFAWLRGSSEAVVRFDPRLVPVDEKQFAAFKAAVEARIRAGDVSDSEVMPGYWGFANA
jgi:hypothetical protein